MLSRPSSPFQVQFSFTSGIVYAYLAMPAVDLRPVCFTRTDTVAVSPGELVFYDIVDANLTSRCGVLSCVAEAGGEAQLPETVTLSDFRSWITAGVPDGNHHRDTPFQTLCTILKVLRLVDVYNSGTMKLL